MRLSLLLDNYSSRVSAVEPRDIGFRQQDREAMQKPLVS
jgi:hypothetical protein